MMKRTFLLAVTTLAALLATSCQKDDLGRVLTATIEQYEHNAKGDNGGDIAKAYINNDNYACWEDNDKVKINGIEYSIHISQDDDHNYSASIQGEVPTGVALTAFYPAHRIDGATITFPYIQEYNSDDNGRQIIDNPMAAYCPANGTELHFRNLGALLKVTLKPANTILVRAIEVMGDDDQMLWGKAQLTQNNNHQLVLTKVASGGNSVVLHFDTPQEVTSSGREFYIVMPANSNFNNLTIALLASENGSYSHHCKTNTVGESLNRNHIGAISYDLDHNNDTFVPAWGLGYTAVNATISPATNNWGSVNLIPSPNGLILFDNVLTTIVNNAFTYRSELKSITLPPSVTSIGSEAFLSCSGLHTVSFSDNLDHIGDNAFNTCTSLVNISLPKHLTTIDIGTFINCNSLESLPLPDSLTTIGDNALYNCSKLKEIILPQKLQSIGKYAFANCKGLTHITIPNGITVIKPYTFAFCSELTDVELPTNLTSIEEKAFYFCEKLHTIKSNLTTPPAMAANSLERDTHDSITVYIPNNTTQAYTSAWNNSPIPLCFQELF